MNQSDQINHTSQHFNQQGHVTNTSTDSNSNSHIQVNGGIDIHSTTKTINTTLAHLLHEINVYEKKLHSLVTQHNPDNTVSITKLRKALRDRYKQVLQNDIEFSSLHDIESQLWRLIYYQAIHEYKLLCKSDCNEHNIMQYKQYLHDASIQYKSLLDEYCIIAKLRITDDGIIDELIGGNNVDYNQQQRNIMICAVNIVYRCLIRLGDIERYRQLIDIEYNNSNPSAPNGAAAAHTNPSNTTSVNMNSKQVLLLHRIPSDRWKLCERYYTLGKSIQCYNGNSYNQLAVVSTYKNDLIYAAYRYIRASAASISFPTANINLKRLLETRADMSLLNALNTSIVNGSNGTNICHHTPQTSECKCSIICDSTNGYNDIEKLYILIISHLLGYITVESYYPCLVQCSNYILKQTMQVPANDKNNLHTLPLRLVCIVIHALQVQSQSSQSTQSINIELKQQCIYTLFELCGTLASVGTTLTSVQSALYIFCQYLNNNRQLVSKQHSDCLGHTQQRWWSGFTALLQIYSRNKINQQVINKSQSCILNEEIEINGYIWFQRLIDKRAALKHDIIYRRKISDIDHTIQYTSNIINIAANESDASQRRIASFFSFASYVARDTSMLHKDKRTGRFVAKARASSGSSNNNNNDKVRYNNQLAPTNVLPTTRSHHNNHNNRIVNIPLKSPVAPSTPHVYQPHIQSAHHNNHVHTPPQYNQSTAQQSLSSYHRVNRSNVDVTTPTNNTDLSLLHRSSISVSPVDNTSVIRSVFLSATAKPFIPSSERSLSTPSNNTYNNNHNVSQQQSYYSSECSSYDNTLYDAHQHAISSDLDYSHGIHSFVDSDNELAAHTSDELKSSTPYDINLSSSNSNDDLILQHGGWSTTLADMSAPFRHMNNGHMHNTTSDELNDDDGWQQWSRQSSLNSSLKNMSFKNTSNDESRFTSFFNQPSSQYNSDNTNQNTSQ